MVEVTILDYAMKVLAKDKFAKLHPDDPVAATEAFAQFMGFFGQASGTCHSNAASKEACYFSVSVFLFVVSCP